MCISAWQAVFSKTITGTWEVLIDDVINHVIWYQNRVGDDSDFRDSRDQTFQYLVRRHETGIPFDHFTEKKLDQVFLLQDGEMAVLFGQLLAEIEWQKAGNQPRTLKQMAGGGNCLIIPIMGSWESIRLLNTADTPNLLQDIDHALEIPLPELARGAPAPAAFALGWGEPAGRIAFMRFDVYDIVIAERASDIGSVIGQIDEEKRPAVNNDVFRALEDLYRCPVAVCCFRASERAESKPLGFVFEPTFPEKLIVYTLDGHDGLPPDLGAPVQLDHTIFVGSYLTPGEYTADVEYKDEIPDHLRPYVLDRVMGMPIVDRQMRNGDIVFETAAVRAGCFDGRRKSPPFAPPRSGPEEFIYRSSRYKNGCHNLHVL